MKREIKFRAWNKATKEMNNYVELYCYKDGSTGCSAGKENNHPIGNTENFELMQFTGLHDMNGKEIYEGDIYKTWYSRDTSGKDIVDVIEVVEFEIKHDTVVCEILFIQNCKIIGNIHQNPELLPC